MYNETTFNCKHLFFRISIRINVLTCILVIDLFPSILYYTYYGLSPQISFNLIPISIVSIKLIILGGLRESNMELTQEQVAYEYGIRYFQNRLYQLYKINLTGIIDAIDQEYFLSIQNPGKY